MSNFRTLVLLCIIIRFVGCNSSQPVEPELAAENKAPSISTIEDQTISRNSQLGPINFTIHDQESDSDSLTLYAKSNNTSLVDSSDICFGGSKENRYLTILPKVGTYGQVKIIIYVSDGVLIDSTSFLLSIVANKNNINYPTTLQPLSESELDILNKELESLALVGDRYRATLNKYGLLEKGGTIGRGSSNIKDQNIAITQAKSSLLYLQKFTNVFDSLGLIVKEATNVHGTPLFDDWLVIFENQIFKGFEVMLTEIMVFINDHYIQIKGYHFKDIYLPENDLINEEIAKRTSVGCTFLYYDYWGQQTFKITDESIIDDLNLVIFPLETENTIELRLTWKIPITSEYEYGSFTPDWYVFLDVLDGKIVDVWQLFKP